MPLIYNCLETDAARIERGEPTYAELKAQRDDLLAAAYSTMLASVNGCQGWDCRCYMGQIRAAIVRVERHGE